MFYHFITKGDVLQAQHRQRDMTGRSMDHYANGTAAESAADGTKLYTIGDLAREFGVTLRTLRFYEDRGLLSPRRDGTARIYDPRDRERLSVILKGKQLGFTLTEIRAMVAEERSGGGCGRGGEKDRSASDRHGRLSLIRNQKYSQLIVNAQILTWWHTGQSRVRGRTPAPRATSAGSGP